MHFNEHALYGTSLGIRLADGMAPYSLTKLMGRGSFQTVGIVSDSGLFMLQLVEILRQEC